MPYGGGAAFSRGHGFTRRRRYLARTQKVCDAIRRRLPFICLSPLTSSRKEKRKNEILVFSPGPFPPPIYSSQR